MVASSLTIGYVTTLSLVDAINPCALAVMTMVLMNLLLYDPNNKKRVLYGGLAFTLAVFILYFLYGLIMIQFFAHTIPATGIYSSYVYKGFGVLAIILGLLNLKDFLWYQPGTIATEMPMTFRPRLKMMLKRVTSPAGAFITGLFVTLFLLPCSIGPYVIFSGKASVLSFFQTLPWLFIYNLIFIIPMLAITFVIFFGVSTIERVSGWKEKNVHLLHLGEAIILIALGILMLTGLI